MLLSKQPVPESKGKDLRLWQMKYEIWQDQTRQETENITTLIDDLSAETNGVVEKVQNSVSLSQVESDAAKTANDHFTGIQDYITELGGRVGKVSEHMQNLYESNNRIVDSVNTLSSTSEEISASAQDVAEASDKKRKSGK